MLWYVLILLGTIVEGEFVLLLAAYFAVQGHLAPNTVAAFAAIGAFVGDLTFFELGRHKGDAFFQKRPGLAKRAAKISRLLTRWPLISVFLLRFQIGMRSLGNFAMGSGKMNRNHYLLLAPPACLLWAWCLSWLCFYFMTLMVPIWSTILGG